MMSSCMTKLEFPLEPYMLFRLGKPPHICCLLLHWVLSSFVDPYERFVMLLKSRSRTHHRYLLLLHWEYAKHAFHLDSPKNVLLLHWEWTQNMLDRFFIHQINAPSSCCYLSKFCYRKEAWGYAKVIHKKRRIREKKSWEKKWTQKCPRYLKQWVLRCPPKKRRDEKIVPAL